MVMMLVKIMRMMEELRVLVEERRKELNIDETCRCCTKLRYVNIFIFISEWKWIEK